MASGARIRPMDGIHFLCRALMRFSAYPLPPGRGWRDWLLPWSLIQDSTAAFASSVAARCVVALSVTSATMLPLPLIENRRALPCKAGGSGCPSFAAEVWSLLVEHASLHMKPHFSPEGLPGPLPSSITSVIRTNGGAAKPRHVSHTHSHHTASPQVFDTHSDIRQVCPRFQTLLSWSPTPPIRPVRTVAVLMGRSFPR